MGVSGGPYIVRDSSLVLELDAADRNSYVSGSSVWNDLTANNYSGSLLNGTAFSSTNGGSFVFDGVDDYITVSEIGQLTRFTVESWFRPTAYPNNSAAVVSSVYPGTNATVNFKIGYEGTSAMYGGTHVGNTWYYSPGVTTNLNTWQQVTFTFDGSNLTIYSNGVGGGSNAFLGTPNSGGAGIRIGRRWDIAEYFVGNISTTKVYNRALSVSEIQQNYNAQKSRFGLK